MLEEYGLDLCLFIALAFDLQSGSSEFIVSWLRIGFSQCA
jgi:hypothetical protein